MSYSFDTVLNLGKVSTKNGNLNKFYRGLGMLAPESFVTVMGITHEDACPCLTEGKAMPSCLCDEVEVSVTWRERGPSDD